MKFTTSNFTSQAKLMSQAYFQNWTHKICGPKINRDPMVNYSKALTFWIMVLTQNETIKQKPLYNGQKHSVYLSLGLSDSLFISLLESRSVWPSIYLFIGVSVCLTICSSLDWSQDLSDHLFISLFESRSLWQSIYLFIAVSACLTVYSSLYWSLGLSDHLFISL